MLLFFTGYCPQFDALLENLTARETLKIFCLLRGIPVKVGLARAIQLANILGFMRHFDKKVNMYLYIIIINKMIILSDIILTYCYYIGT